MFLVRSAVRNRVLSVLRTTITLTRPNHSFHSGGNGALFPKNIYSSSSPLTIPATGQSLSIFPPNCKDFLTPPSAYLIPKCYYAKGKSKGGKGKKGAMKVMSLSDEELNSVIDKAKLILQMDNQLKALKHDLTNQLSLRTSLGSFDNLAVETSDGKFPLNQLGQISQKGQNIMVINLSSSPQYIQQVKDALLETMSLNAQSDGTTLFVNVPKVTREYREGLAKTAKGMSDKAKTKLREVQTHFLKDIRKVKGDHSEDLVHNVQQYIQDKTKEYSEQAEHLTSQKQKELLGGK